MITNKEIRAAARQELSGFWTMPVLATLVCFLISSFCSVPNMLSVAFPTNLGVLVGFSSVSWVLSILVLVPLSYGFYLCFLKFLRGSKEDTVERLFDGFKTYGRALGLVILQSIFTILWTLLLIVPGIIKAFAYSMSVYISNDHPELSVNECIDRSIDMMKGHKWDLFKLYLSFIGWFFLCLPTFGIGFLWLVPYVNVSVSKFYEELRAQEEAEMEAMME